MNNPTQHRSWIHGICRRAAGAAVALAVVLVPTVLATGSAQAQTFTTLHSFDSTDGSEPYAGLVQGTNGDLYGTTQTGGASYGGTVFKITPSGTLTTLYSFCLEGYPCTDGAYPFAGLVQATNGDLYGTTSEGGAHGDGTIFKITPSGKLTTLHSFDGTDGKEPGGLVQATNGDLYGTTSMDGAHGDGTIFKITPGGTLTTLYSFCSQKGCPDGAWPLGLVQATNGDLYGTTANGGANNYGTVFEITPKGTLTTLYSFCSQSSCTDGEYPSAGLIQATDGNFYGTTSAGGANGWGTVFEITPNGTLTTLYSFCSQSSCTDGDDPNAELVQATNGSFYGTTPLGGLGGYNGYGTVFEITPKGTLTTLYSFCSQSSCTDGDDPNGGLVQATNGNFYGTTYVGGANVSCNGGYGCGTVFSLSLGLGPFVQARLTMGKVGAKIIILGNSLIGSTAVSFDSVAATTFKVVSSTEMTATVPSGALTGTLSVTTPSGTLESNGPFWVTPQLKSFKPAKGPVGTQVQVTGVSLTQTTEVSFDGVSAIAFTVNSDTEVIATVPTGATTGTITITTLGGTATSTKNFTVTE